MHIRLHEAVGRGHPDKIADQIADRILDSILAQDLDARAAIEVVADASIIMITGETATSSNVDYIAVASDVLDSLGYDAESFQYINNVHQQSSELTKIVSQDRLLANDQGIVVGYATNETPEYLPIGQAIANDIITRGDEYRMSVHALLGPDMKVLVAIGEVHTNESIEHRLLSLTFSGQQTTNVPLSTFRKTILDVLILPVLAARNISYDPDTLLINPAGTFINAGLYSDTGLTGRKLIADSYGAIVPHGGGAYSGKDYTKIDRSAAYAARWIAKQLVAAGYASRLLLQLSYVIGQEYPRHIEVHTFGTGVENEIVISAIKEVFDLRLDSIVEQLSLRLPIYYQTSYHGHFGRSEFTWEKLDKIRELRKFLRQALGRE